MYTAMMFVVGLIGFSQFIATQDVLKEILIATFTLLVVFVLQKMKGQEAIRLMKEKENQKEALEKIEVIENKVRQLQVGFACSPFSAKFIGGSGYDLEMDQSLRSSNKKTNSPCSRWSNFVNLGLVSLNRGHGQSTS